MKYPWEAHYRAGQFEPAIRRAHESLEANPPWIPALNWLILALAHHRIGQIDEARQWFVKADESFRQMSQWFSQSPAAPRGHHWIEIELLHREARGVLGSE